MITRTNAVKENKPLRHQITASQYKMTLKQNGICDIKTVDLETLAF